MKIKASIERDFMKVSRDLEEALARGPFTACELRVIGWVKSRTYGVRVKIGERWVALDGIPLTSCFVANETGLNRQRVKEAVEALLDDQVLRRKVNGWIGINSRLGDWKRKLQGDHFDFDEMPRTDIGRRTWDKACQVQGVSQTPVQGVPEAVVQGVPEAVVQGVPEAVVQGVSGATGALKERARVEVLEKESGREAPNLPNGKNDTPHARAEAGLAEFPPMDHPAYARLSFKMQDKLADRWEAQVAELRKKTTCRKCQLRPRHSDKWEFCRACTNCVDCERPAGGGLIFHFTNNEIICKDCKEKKS